MNDMLKLDPYATMVAPATLKIERILPGPASRVWDYLTKSEMRRQWLAAGDMELAVGAPFELVWRNDELTDPPANRPEGFSEENRMQSRITAVDAPHLLAFTWGGGEVTFRLKEIGKDVQLTIVHANISDRGNTLMIGAGWHMHLDVLAAKMNGRKPEPFWAGWQRLRTEYDGRMPA